MTKREEKSDQDIKIKSEYNDIADRSTIEKITDKISLPPYDPTHIVNEWKNPFKTYVDYRNKYRIFIRTLKMLKSYLKSILSVDLKNFWG